MLEVGSTSSRETGGAPVVLPLVGTEADLGTVIVRLARLAAAAHMAQAAIPGPTGRQAPINDASRGVGKSAGGA